MSIWWVIGALASVVYLVRFCHAEESYLKSVIKTASIAALSVGAVLAGGPWALVAALAVSALGDWLISRDSQLAFKLGVAAFAAGHLLYVGLFLAHPLAVPERLYLHPAPWVIMLLGVLGALVAVQLFPRAGNLRWPVMAYIPIILSMGAVALVLPATGRLIWAKIGAGVFILSDLVLAQELFVLSDASRLQKVAPYVVWSTYWIAQACLTYAFLPTTLV